MKNRVKNLLNSLINQYEQLIDVRFDGDAPDVVNKTAELKLKHHLALLETSIKQLINMGTPIFTFYGRTTYDMDAFVVTISEDDEIEGIDNNRDRLVFINFVKTFMVTHFDLKFTNFISEHSESVESYCKLIEAIELRNKDFKYRTTTLLMCCSDY